MHTTEISVIVSHMIYQYWSFVNKMSGSVINPGRFCTIRQEIHDARIIQGRLQDVMSSDTFFITPMSTSDGSFRSFLVGSSGKITTEKSEQIAEEMRLMPLWDLLYR